MFLQSKHLDLCSHAQNGKISFGKHGYGIASTQVNSKFAGGGFVFPQINWTETTQPELHLSCEKYLYSSCYPLVFPGYLYVPYSVSY